MPFTILRNDITRMHVDAIVNSANPAALVGGGVDRAIHQAAGPELLAARQAIGPITTGEAAITPAFHLPARYVIHTVGPVWRDGRHDERALLASCYQRSLFLAHNYGCRSIAFPLISAGVFGCPAEIAISVAAETCRAFLREEEMDISLVIFASQPFRIESGLFSEIQSYIDTHYVEDALEEEYRGDRPACERRPDAMDAMPAPESAPKKKKHLLPPGVIGSVCPDANLSELPKELQEELLTETEDSFSEALLHLIDRSGKTDAEIYKRANIDRRLFSKIRSHPDYQPSKATALAFAVALQLSLPETRQLLARAGYALSHSSKADIIVEYFIRHHEYDILTINEALFSFSQPLLGR